MTLDEEREHLTIARDALQKLLEGKWKAYSACAAVGNERERREYEWALARWKDVAQTLENLAKP